MEFSENLEYLGVHENLLKPWEKEKLQEDGYLIIENVIDKDTLQNINQTIDNLFEEEEEAGNEYYHEEGVRRLAALFNKGDIFDQIYSNPKVLAATYFILNEPFRLNLLNVRDVFGGYGEQSYHADWGEREDNNKAYAVNSIWMLDDFTNTNGATKIIPKSHLLDIPSKYNLDDFKEKEILVTAKAGSVLIFNAHLWHAGTENLTNSRRRCIHNFYCLSSSNRKIELAPSIKKQKDASLLQILGVY